MQKYRGIVMGRRKINKNETEVEIEGSGDDHEPQGLALLVTKFDNFQQNMNRTGSTLVQQLDDYHETSRRGQTEISETLKKFDENNQTKLG